MTQPMSDTPTTPTDEEIENIRWIYGPHGSRPSAVIISALDELTQLRAVVKAAKENHGPNSRHFRFRRVSGDVCGICDALAALTTTKLAKA